MFFILTTLIFVQFKTVKQTDISYLENMRDALVKKADVSSVELMKDFTYNQSFIK